MRLLDRVLIQGVVPAFGWLADAKAAPESAFTLTRWREHFEPLLNAKKLASVIPIVADNVAHYYWCEVAQENWELSKDFPCIAPPFDRPFWIEYKVPKYSLTTGGTKISMNEGMGGIHVGCYIEPYDLVAQDYSQTFSGGWRQEMLTDYKRRGCRWLLGIRIVTCERKDPPIGGGSMIVAVKEDGTALTKMGARLPGEEGADVKISIPGLMEEAVPQDLLYDAFTAYNVSTHPAFLALCFMHCKNVTQRTTVPSCKLNKKHKRRTGNSLIQYTTLEIDPTRSQSRSKSDRLTSIGERSLHICRGHFKTYTKDRPLLGKHTGTYWWPSHVRGTEYQGTVIHGYNVKGRNG